MSVLFEWKSRSYPDPPKITVTERLITIDHQIVRITLAVAHVTGLTLMCDDIVINSVGGNSQKFSFELDLEAARTFCDVVTELLSR